MKDFLEKLIAAKKDEFKKMQERSDASTDLAEVRSIGATLKGLSAEIAEAEAQLRKLDEAEKETENDAKKSDEGRKMVLAGGMESRKAETADGTSSLE